MSGSRDNVTMQDPIAFFLTWPTFGTWLPGDRRGWVEYHHGWQLPSPNLEAASRTVMKEQACILNSEQRMLVEQQVAETCRIRGWTLFVVQCRSNHVHILVGAVDTRPSKIRADIKAYCTRRLRTLDSGRQSWWADRGSVRYIWNQDSLERVLLYITEAQDRKHLDGQ